MEEDLKKGDRILREIILFGVIFIFFFFMFKFSITGNVVNETSNETLNQTSCSLAWQPCFSNESCCEGLSCLGGTCKTFSVSNQTINQTSNQTAIDNQTINQSSCNLEWQPCVSNLSCCAGLNCLGGTCKQPSILVIDEEESSEENLPIPICQNSGESCNNNFNCCDNLLCLNGICKENKIACVDSDGGKNPYLKGHTSGFNEDMNYLLFIEDNCTSSNDKLEEFYCQNETIHFELTSCPNGCENGVCKCKSSSQLCSSNLECCSGFNCVNKICTSQTTQLPTSLKNKILCTFIGHPCELNEDCCSNNCIPTQKFLFWKSESKKCGPVKLNKTKTN